MFKLFLFFFHTNNLFLTEIIKLAKGENDNQTQLAKMTLCELDGYEMQVRSANIGKLKKIIRCVLTITIKGGLGL
jgi:hypothetical protein